VDLPFHISQEIKKNLNQLNVCNLYEEIELSSIDYERFCNKMK
jgi:hypothetical protein